MECQVFCGENNNKTGALEPTHYELTICWLH